MIKSIPIPKFLLNITAILIAAPLTIQAASTVFDNFDVDEGHFALQPSFSGSTVGILTTSTADRVTVSPIQGAGCEQLIIYTNGAATARIRFLSGGGTIGNNTAFTTSGATDGWIGFYAKTTNAGWTVQLWIENASVNGGVPKAVINDGQWHLYEWDLDNTAGDADGWGSISGILDGAATVADGSHSIDSIVLRNATLPDATSSIFIDYVARNDSGHVGDLLVDPCNNTSGVLVSGPLSANSNQVVVAGVSGSATKLTVYQDSGSGMVAIGTKTTGVTAGNNTVTVAGIVKGAIVAATQTIAGQDSCTPTTGVLVGGGANPKLRVALSIRENPTATGPVGLNGTNGLNQHIHFMPCTSLLSGPCPGDGAISITPSTSWQTVTVPGREGIANPAHVAAAVSAPAEFQSSYLGSPADTVTARVYAYRTLPTTGIIVYSPTGGQSSGVTSNGAFVVNWTWDAVAGAEGYRLVRDMNATGYLQYHDVLTGTSFADSNDSWLDGSVVTPAMGQVAPSMMWFDTVGNANNIVGDWGVLECIALVNDDPTDCGPYNIYIDNLENGTNGVFQDFEGFVAGTVAGTVFNQPSYSGTTGGSLLSAPNDASIVNEAAYAGTKSQRVQWQFKTSATNLWLRFNTFNTSVMPNPLVNLNQPISFKILVEPVGSTPVAPARPSIAVSQFNGKTVLTWTGAHNLQTSVNVSGAYTNVPAVTVAPYTNSFTEAQRYFRLAN